MVMWPFRRKSGRKRPRSGTAHSDAEGSPRITHAGGVVTRGALKKKQRTEPASSRQMGRRYSFSPGRPDSLATDGRRMSVERHGQPARRHEQGNQSEQPWTRTPTLHHKETNRNRRGKSHKRKMEERARAAEIKAMSNFEPVRPAAEPWMAGRPMKRESKKARAAPGFGVPRTSDVSLPLPDPMDSNMSSDSEYHSYKVSALDSLAPRPTLRYAPGPRDSPTRPPRTAQSSKQGRPAAVDQDLAKETGYRRHKRIDDLADGLDASGLREMMEREDRRRERKRQKDRERAVRRLARKAEQQKAEEAEARKAGTPPPENLERGVAGRELVGLGIDPASSVRTSSKHRRSTSPPRRTSNDSPDIAEAAEPSDPEKEERRKSPVESFLRPESMVLDDENAADDDVSDDEKRIERPQPPSPQLEPPHKETLQDEAIQEETLLEGLPFEKPTHPLSPSEPKAQDSYPSLQHSSRLGSLLRLRRTKSKSTVGSELAAEDSTRKSATSSELKRRFSFSKLFRWGSRRFRKNTAQSSFSNTSRDEMMAAVAAAKNQTPAQANAEALARLQGQDISIEPNSGYYLSRKSGSVRTKSRFREELPEFPLSPPDSRVQSPEAEPPLPVVEENSTDEVRTQPIPIPGASESQKSKSISTEGPSPDPQPLSMSMASIDSEASWLSGRVKSQKSQRSSAMRESLRRANQLQEAPVSNSPAPSAEEEEEDHAIANDAYMARLTPTQHLGMFTNQRHGDGRPSSDDEDYFDEDGAKWGDVASRPQLVEKTRRSTLKSQEGLLNIESEDEEMTTGLPSPKPSLKKDEN